MPKACEEQLAYNPPGHKHQWSERKPDDGLHCRVIGCNAPGPTVLLCSICGALRCPDHIDVPVATMDAMNRTPRPWRVLDRGGMGYDINPVPCGIRGAFDLKGDAILASTAPDLAGEIEWFLSLVDANDGAITQDQFSEAISRFTTVIAKANGADYATDAF